MDALRQNISASVLALLAAVFALPATAQVPVDDNDQPVADYESFDAGPGSGNEDIPLLTKAELQELVGPIALYPDDLLAIVLPASTYPLQLVQAQRFLDDLEQDPSLKPDEDWDDSVVALLNYPEVVELLNADLDWTWQLGEAVVAQETDVIAAVSEFRDRAYAAGNLRSDTHQTVSRSDDAIEITPVEDDVIYVPYYEPERVVVYQTQPVYYYYPHAYPVYYYPYPDGYAFNSGFFWGVTTAFTVGWLTDTVHVYHHSYFGHPYYGYHYWDGWWYRRPTINVYNNYYSDSRYAVSRDRYRYGDHWRPRYEHRRHLSNQRIARSNFYTERNYTRPQIRDSQAYVQRATSRSQPAVERRRNAGSTTPVTRHNERSGAGSATPATRHSERSSAGSATPVTRHSERSSAGSATPVTRHSERSSAETGRSRFVPERTRTAERTRFEPNVRSQSRERRQPVVARTQVREQAAPVRRDARQRPSAVRVEPRAESRRERPARQVAERQAAPARESRSNSSTRREQKSPDRGGRGSSRADSPRRQRH